MQVAFAMPFAMPGRSKYQQIFSDVLVLWKQWAVVLVIIAIHLAVVFGVKLPLCERGYLGEK